MERLLLEVAQEFDKDTTSVKHLRTSHNQIYICVTKSDTFILRVTSIKHRNLDEIISELDFQTFLYENGAPVVTPRKTYNHRSVVPCEINNKKYFIAAFSLADGNNWDNRSDFNPETWYQIGCALGRIHALSKQYHPHNINKRRLWKDSQHLQKAYRLFRAHSNELLNAFQKHIALIEIMTIDKSVYGLTHGDYLLSNYMIDDNNRVIVFDFDACEHSWYAVDLAICMHCYRIGAAPDELNTRGILASEMLFSLLSGYRTESGITFNMVNDLDVFFKLRDYIYLSTILEKTEHHDWDKRFVETALDRLVGNKPFLVFDTSKSVKLITPAI